MNLNEEVGITVISDQLAEECNELAHVCMKLSRKLRGENPTPVRYSKIIDNLHEEISDVVLCIDLLEEKKFIDSKQIDIWKENKRRRWIRRLEEHHKNKSDRKEEK